LSTANWGGIKVNDASGQTFTNGYSKPCFANVDADPDIELLLGSVTGEVQVYDNPSIDSQAVFVRLPDFTPSKFGVYSAPAAAMLNGQDPTLVVGTFGGGLALVQASSTLEVDHLAQQGPRAEILCFPNPAQTSLDIQANPLLSKGRIQVFNAAGQSVYDHPKLGSGININVAQWPRGIYLVLVQAGQLSAYSKVVLN
jgi:Secretion system C-terminal sorting domain